MKLVDTRQDVNMRSNQIPALDLTFSELLFKLHRQKQESCIELSWGLFGVQSFRLTQLKLLERDQGGSGMQPGSSWWGPSQQAGGLQTCSVLSWTESHSIISTRNEDTEMYGVPDGTSYPQLHAIRIKVTIVNLCGSHPELVKMSWISIPSKHRKAATKITIR